VGPSALLVEADASHLGLKHVTLHRGMTTKEATPIRVAVVGSGLAGLATAYFLTRNTRGVDVTLFERHAALGMDAESVTVEHEGEHQRIDVPMRAFSAAYYPNLVVLYKHLRIGFDPQSFSFSFAHKTDDAHGGPVPDFLYRGRRNKGPRCIRRGSMARPLFWVSTVWSYLVMVILAWLYTVCGYTPHRRTFGEWCDSIWMAQSFVDELLYPMFSSIMTADMAAVRAMPTREVLEYVAHTFLYRHYRVRGGVSQVVHALTDHLPADRVRVGATITDVFPVDTHRIGLRYKASDGSQAEAVYDHLIFGSQTTQTAIMLQWYHDHTQPSSRAIFCAQQLAQLRALHYKKSTVVCHTDTGILPPDEADWRDLNFVTPACKGAHDAYTMATHVIHRSPAQVVMQTTNPLPQLFPAADKTIRQSTFDRFVLTLEGRQAREHFFQRRGKRRTLGPLQGSPDGGGGGVWFTGSWSYGVPLLEGCVTSARLVAERILQQHDLDASHIASILD